MKTTLKLEFFTRSVKTTLKLEFFTRSVKTTLELDIFTRSVKTTLAEREEYLETVPPPGRTARSARARRRYFAATPAGDEFSQIAKIAGSANSICQPGNFC